jgi:hypothetical protein
MTTYRLIGATDADGVLGQITSALAHLSALGLAESATLHAAATPADDVGSTITIAFGETADQPQLDHGGDSLVRIADAYLATTTIPAADARVVISAGAHAGTWTVLGIERRDACGCLDRLRLTTRRATRSPAAREVLR